MSLSPSFPQGAPTLAEVLLSRTFAKPPQPFVDGEFLETLAHADDDKPAVTVEIAQPQAGGGAADSGKVYLCGVGVIGRLEPADYWDGEE
jgi:hypothetical protein